MENPADWIDLSGKVAHVTGGGKGIGRGICHALASAGAKVMVSDVNLEGAQTTADEIDGNAMILDVTDRAAVDAAMSSTAETLGGLDILVNNAGVYQQYGGPVGEITDEMWRTLWSVNVDGVFYCCRAAAAIMQSQGHGGRIINVSSVVGASGNPGQANYVASKAGLIGLTKSVAKELASRDITVNAVAPGFIETDMTASLVDKAREAMVAQIPLGRAGTARDIAAAVMFLASDHAAYITGQVIHINGGMYM